MDWTAVHAQINGARRAAGGFWIFDVSAAVRAFLIRLPSVLCWMVHCGMSSS